MAGVKAKRKAHVQAKRRGRARYAFAGIAANESMKRNRPVRIDSLVKDLPLASRER